MPFNSLHLRTSTFCLFIPWIIIVAMGYFLIQPVDYYLKEIAGFSLMTLAAASFTAIFLKHKIRKTLELLCYVFLAFFAFVKLSFYLQYGVAISASALFVIFETNSGEATDYLSNYFSAATIILALALLAPIILMLRAKPLMKAPQRPKSRFKNIIRAFVLLSITVVCLFVVRKKFAVQNIPYATFSTWGAYKIAKQNLRDNLAQPTSAAFTEVTSSNASQTYVVVIGESTSRWHMQLYGYNRPTNPKLNSIKDELIVMDSVITPHVHTITALEKILTLADFSTPKPEPNGSIIQLANQAGFKTYWLSNQKPVGLYESIPTILGSAATTTTFMATEDYNHQIYDGDLLPKLEEILGQKDISKKIIFIHLIGSHLKYEKRYPKSYDFFVDPSPTLAYSHAKAVTQTNVYDNTIRYNDEVIFQIIESLRKAEGFSYMAYFSDHGDEVYDTMDFLGHNEYHATRPMFEVPMLFWFSPKYRKEMGSISEMYAQRRYSLEHFPYTFAQLSGISFKGYDATKSVLDSTFSVRKRIYKETEDYDER